MVRATSWRKWQALLKGERVLADNLVVAGGTFIAGLFGVTFQSFASHQLRPSDFGSVFLVVTLINFIGLPASASTLLMARQTSRDRAFAEDEPSAALLRHGNRTLVLTGAGLSAIVALLSPPLSGFLNVPYQLLLVGAASIPFSLALPLLLGEFQGDQRFVVYSTLSAGQAGLKLLLAAILGRVWGPFGIIAGISLASAVAYFTALWLVKGKLAVSSTAPWLRPAGSYFVIVLPSTLALAVLLSADVLIVKHFFPAHVAGEYAAVGALGRAIFWGAGGVSAVLFPKVVFRIARGQTGADIVGVSLLLVTFGGLLGLGLLSVAAKGLLTAFAGPAYSAASNYLPGYAVGMMLLGGVAVLVATNQSTGKAKFLGLLLPLTMLEPVLLVAFHGSLNQEVIALDISMALIFASLATFYLVQRRTLVRPAEAGPGYRLTNAPRGGSHSPRVVFESVRRQPLRILILNWRCPRNPWAGGAERVTHEIAKRLVAQGHSVEWFSAAFEGGHPIEELDGIHMVRAGSRYSVYWHAFRRYRKDARSRFDLIVDEVNVVPFFTPLWAKLPTCMFIHQLAREIWWYEASIPLSAIGFLTEPLYLQFYRRVPILTVSDSTKSDLVRIGLKGPIYVLPPGLETTTREAVEKPNEPTFLYVGRLVRSKRIEFIISALALFRQATGRGTLKIVGGGSPTYRRSLVRHAQRLGVDQSVSFLGHISTSAKHRLMAEAHLLLMTSAREGWGLVVTEANACGTPAIVYDVPGLRDSVRHNVTGLVVPERPQALADAMVRVLGNHDLYESFVTECRRWTATLSFDRTALAVARALDLVSARAPEIEPSYGAAVQTSDTAEASPYIVGDH